MVKCKLVAQKHIPSDSSWKTPFMKGRKFSHVSLLVGKKFYEGGYGTVLSYIHNPDDVKEHKDNVVIEFEITKKEAKRLHKRYKAIDGWHTYKTKDYVRFLQTGVCKTSKKKQGMACSCFAAYLLGVKKFWKMNSDDVVKHVKM